jgi:acetate kinase
MGFTPLPGLVMGTRSGDIDPSIALHLMQDGDFSSEDISSMLTKESGLVGMSGVSDMRDLFNRAESGDDAASHAIDVWVWRARHYLGAYIAHLGGLDVIVFTGGIGENQATLRERITEDTDFIGLDIDHTENVKASNSPRPISSTNSDVAVWVIPTNEELHIARLAARAL